MPVYSLSPIFEAQFVSASAAALAMAPTGATDFVPANFNYQLASCHVSNVGAIPVSLMAWRVPAGGSAGNDNLVLPSVNIPVATNTFPYFDLTTLWGVVLRAGDQIVMEAGVANSLVVHGDGAVVSI